MKARQAKKFLKSLSVADVNRGDVILVRVRGPEEVKSAGELALFVFPRNRSVILLPGQSISVITEGTRG